MIRNAIVGFTLMCTQVFAHQMIPTYLKLESTSARDVMMTYVDIFNKRKDVEYYEFSVYDDKWNAIDFASEERLINLQYLHKKRVVIYIRRSDSARATYVCSLSRIESSKATATTVNSRICSKIK